MTTSKPLCWVPYYTAELTYSRTSPCCKIDTGDSPPYPDIRNFKSDHAAKWRQHSFMGDALQSQCSACTVPNSVHSYERQNRRLFLHDGWTEPTEPQLRKLIIGMDNICASSCIQCGPHFSTTLNNLAKTKDYQLILGQQYTLPGTQQLDFDQLDGQLADLEILHLFGGEPLISPNLEKLITMIRQQSPKLRRITLSTGLCRIKERNVALLADLGVPVQCNVSLDGPTLLNSWIRGITEQEFREGWNLLLKYAPNINITGFQTTLGCYNVFALPQLIDFIQSLWSLPKPPYIMSTVILRPKELHPSQLPSQYKSHVIDKLRNYSAADTTPIWAKELFRTALFALQPDADKPWPAVQSRLNAYAGWRGDSSTWQTQYDHYMST